MMQDAKPFYYKDKNVIDFELWVLHNIFLIDEEELMSMDRDEEEQLPIFEFIPEDEEYFEGTGFHFILETGEEDDEFF